eukprot:1497551-Pyramimonas_sp.AAC.2
MEDSGWSTRNPLVPPTVASASDKGTAYTEQQPLDPWEKYYSKRGKYVRFFLDCLLGIKVWLKDKMYNMYLQLELCYIQLALWFHALRREKPNVATSGAQFTCVSELSRFKRKKSLESC